MSAKIELTEEEGAGIRPTSLAADMRIPQAEDKDHVYITHDAFLYTTASIVSASTTRYSASILLTVRRAPFEITIEGRTSSHQAVAIRPVVERGLRAQNAQLISAQVNPTHPLFRRFRAIPSPGYLPLERDAFAEFEEKLDAAYRGQLTGDDAGMLLEEIIARTSRYLPKVKRADPRIERALDMLRENPSYPLTELAAAIGLSYDRMSHLFAEVVGLPLRSYLLWLKINAASLLRGSGMTLTEIADAAGFNDSAHLCNTWQQAFGRSPSSFFVNTDDIAVHLAKEVKQPLASRRTPVFTTKTRAMPVPASPPEPTSDEQDKACAHCGAQHPHKH